MDVSDCGDFLRDELLDGFVRCKCCRREYAQEVLAIPVDAQLVDHVSKDLAFGLAARPNPIATRYIPCRQAVLSAVTMFSGSRTENVVPAPALLSTSIEPPCC